MHLHAKVCYNDKGNVNVNDNANQSVKENKKKKRKRNSLSTPNCGKPVERDVENSAIC